MSDFKYGDLVCYKRPFAALGSHDGPIMYVTSCGHKRTRWAADLMDIVPLDAGAFTAIDHKDPNMWQKCEHFMARLS